MSTAFETATERLRAVLERESDARLALKRARAARSLDLARRGDRVTVVWRTSAGTAAASDD
jgi:hypothetical protein